MATMIEVLMVLDDIDKISPEEKPIEGEITGIPEGSTMSDTDDKK